MVNETVRDKLIEVAKSKDTIYYERLVRECGLILNLDYANDRNKLSQILLEIDDFEIRNQRPILSVIAVQKKKNEKLNVRIPGNGFFEFINGVPEKDGGRKKNESDEDAFNRIVNEVWKRWRKNE